MRESDLLTHIYTRSADLAAAFPFVRTGPGDDCAVISPKGDLLLKVDQLVEHRHFTPDTPLDLVARKAIARTVSDIAAMAGTPLCALAAATLPTSFPQDRADALFDAMSTWARRFNCPLVGGDIASGPGPLVLSVTLIGTPHPVRGPVLRSTAQPGDEVYVTGPLGGSLESGRHLTFTPRLAEATLLADTLGPDLHAMMDISDGLGIDAGRLARASGVRIVLEQSLLPLNPDITDPLRALRDGEDYELLFTTSPTSLPPGCTRIGTVEPGQGVFLNSPTGRTDASTLGWDHR